MCGKIVNASVLGTACFDTLFALMECNELLYSDSMMAGLEPPRCFSLLCTKRKTA